MKTKERKEMIMLGKWWKKKKLINTVEPVKIVNDANDPYCTTLEKSLYIMVSASSSLNNLPAGEYVCEEDVFIGYSFDNHRPKANWREISYQPYWFTNAVYDIDSFPLELINYRKRTIIHLQAGERLKSTCPIPNISFLYYATNNALILPKDVKYTLEVISSKVFSVALSCQGYPFKFGLWEAQPKPCILFAESREKAIEIVWDRIATEITEKFDVGEWLSQNSELIKSKMVVEELGVCDPLQKSLKTSFF